jgi:hypothetical protein
MKFLVMVKANKDSEAGALPDEAMLSGMMKYNEELQKAGVLLDLAGLTPSVRGSRIKFEGGKRSVVDGPFAEAKELVAGYWLLQCKSKQECIEWIKRAPMGDGAEIEIRPLFEMEDFPQASAETRDRAAKIEQALK